MAMATTTTTGTTTTPTNNLADKLQINLDDPLLREYARPVVRVVGHRGALYEHVENTVDGFEQCVTWGLHGVELDVFLLPDQTLVVFHGLGVDQKPGALEGYCSFQDTDTSSSVNASVTATVVNNSNKTSILDLTYQETQQLEFTSGSKHLPCPPDRLVEARIPTLEQVLRKLKGTGIVINVELKGKGTMRPTLELVEKLDMVDQCTFSSFYHERLKQLRQLRPDKTKYRIRAIFGADVPDDFLEAAKDCGATEIHLRYDTCTVERIKAIREAGLPSMAYSPGPVELHHHMNDTTYSDIQSERHLYEMVLATGVDMFCCNRPNLVQDILKERADKELGAVPMVTENTSHCDHRIVG